MTTPNFVASVTVDNVMDAIKEFVLLFMPIPAKGCDPRGQVVRAEQNRVPLPPAPCAVLTELFGDEMNVPYDVFDGIEQITTINASTKIDVQVDFYGEIGGDIMKAVKQAFRTEWGWLQFPANIKPMYTDNGRQMPLTTGEDQYLRRWTLTASLQYNPAVTVPQPSATVLKATVHTPVDFPVT